jgi:hypothetical protein
MPSYRKRSKQQYVVKRKKIISKVESKLKKAAKASKKKPKVEALPAAAPAPKVKEAEAPLGKGRKATLRFKGFGLNIKANVRYETEKVDPLIKTAYVADGKIVTKKFIGPKKRVAWVDEDGKEHDKSKVQQVQILKDGRMIPIKIEKTKVIEVEAVPAKVMDEFHPYSFLEVWGEDDEDVDAIRDLAFELKTRGMIGAVKKFSHGYGKIYVGFLKPIISKDGKHFVFEIMLSENKKKWRRWMPTEKALTKARKQKAAEPEVPDLW